MAYEAGLLPCRLFSPLSPTPPSFLRRSYLTSRSPSTSQRGVRCELGAVSSSNPTRPMTTTCRSLSQLLPHAGVVHLPGLKTVKAVLGHVPTVLTIHHGLGLQLQSSWIYSESIRHTDVGLNTWTLLIQDHVGVST